MPKMRYLTVLRVRLGAKFGDLHAKDLFVAKRMRILGMQIPNFCAQTWGPTVLTLCNMHLKLMHFGSNFACILGRFLVYIGLNLNAKYSGF